MEIISMSLDKDTLDELDKTQEHLGFKSRSKLIRATIKSLVNEYSAMESLKGHIDGVFVVSYKESEKHRVSDLLHKFEDSIETTIHRNHVGICLEVLIVCAEAKRIRDLFSMLKKDKGVRSVSWSVL